MYCYRDMTFCSHYKECVTGVKCHRALTDIVRKNAAHLDIPICQFTEKPECFVNKKQENQKKGWCNE